MTTWFMDDPFNSLHSSKAFFSCHADLTINSTLLEVTEAAGVTTRLQLQNTRRFGSRNSLCLLIGSNFEN